jgi:glycosyltransferase involved in cell wall biosynthesis
MTADVSIIIPAYGVAHTLDATIESAVNCGANVEVIVVDDASVDGSFPVAERAAQVHGVRVIRRDSSGGPARARNEGLAVALGAARSLPRWRRSTRGGLLGPTPSRTSTWGRGGRRRSLSGRR